MSILAGRTPPHWERCLSLITKGNSDGADGQQGQTAWKAVPGRDHLFLFTFSFIIVCLRRHSLRSPLLRPEPLFISWRRSKQPHPAHQDETTRSQHPLPGATGQALLAQTGVEMEMEMHVLLCMTTSSCIDANVLQKPAVESAVTRLLVSIKQLLESLTRWSRQEVSETDVSDVYVRLGNDFNAAVAAFASFNIDMRCVLSLVAALPRPYVLVGSCCQYQTICAAFWSNALQRTPTQRTSRYSSLMCAISSLAFFKGCEESNQFTGG